MEDPTELYNKAVKKESSWLKIFYDDSDYENIADMYNRSGDLFRNNKQWVLSINSYNAAIKIFIRINDPLKTIELYQYITNIYSTQLNDIDNAIINAQNCINICPRNYKSNVAKLYKVLGTLYEKKNNYIKAIESYESSANVYTFMNYHTQDIKQCFHRIAELYCILEEYKNALLKYKEILNLSKSQYRNYIDDSTITKIVLCNIIDEDIVGAKNTINTFMLIKSPTSTFLKNIITSVENTHYNMFIDTTNSLTEIHKLDNIDNILISKIKSMYFINNTYTNIQNIDNLTNVTNETNIDNINVPNINDTNNINNINNIDDWT